MNFSVILKRYVGGDALPANHKGAIVRTPKEPRQWNEGSRIGPELRKVVAIAGDTGRRSKGGAHASPRPHIRRGHFRSSRIGPGRLGRRSVWIPPVRVNCRFGEPIPVERRVTEQ